MGRKLQHPSSRKEAIHRLRKQLERASYPRLQMMLLVGTTGAVGFVASFGLLRFGLEQMSVRYATACVVAYLAFLCLLWLWMRTRSEDYVDLPDGTDFSPGYNSHGDGFAWNGGGGQSGGGGASASFDSPSVSSSFSSENTLGDAFGSVADADELAIPLLVMGLVLILLLSSLFVVYSAPVLFAELLLDGVLAAGLYRRLRRIETRHWLETAVRRTLWPFVLTALLLAAVGYGMAIYVPGADSIGDVLHHVRLQ